LKRLQDKSKGFTLIELITVIVILGILGVVALGKFQDLSEDAHTAVARATLGEFSSIGMTTFYNYRIERDADPTTVEVRPGVTLPVNAQGWAGSPFTNAACLNLWQTLMVSSEPMNPWGTVPFGTSADGWEYLGTGAVCAYLYKPDVTPFKLIIYFPDNGTPTSGRIYGFGI